MVLQHWNCMHETGWAVHSRKEVVDVDAMSSDACPVRMLSEGGLVQQLRHALADKCTDNSCSAPQQHRPSANSLRDPCVTDCMLLPQCAQPVSSFRFFPYFSRFWHF